MLPKKINPIFKLIFSLVATFFFALLGSLITTPNISSWYVALNKPSFTPPNWLFGPAWSLLYLLMAIAFFLVWQKEINHKTFKSAINIFFIQLFVNFFWSAAFFGFKSPLAGLITITVLWVLIILNIKIFYKISPPAGLLLVPYIAWVSFASILNFAVWRLN